MSASVLSTRSRVARKILRIFSASEKQVVVDMSEAAVTYRLREVGRLLAQRGFVQKGVLMTAPAVTARLKIQGALSDMCRRLTPVGERLRPARGDHRLKLTPFHKCPKASVSNTPSDRRCTHAVGIPTPSP
jgi:hypothetical protein